ncbi:hypothetical protein, partial [Nostoc sp. LEGE 12447]|uniref:hypothetical protein n=1 Tax=Nostoc sp. LEGE 12447 TaxID=1828640 RepID=UPI001D135779
CKISMPVPATTESSAAFPSCVNVHSSSFLLTIALDIQDSRYNFFNPSVLPQERNYHRKQTL